MLDPDETIEVFRQGKLDLDCKRMVLTQRKKKGGERFTGKGYIRQLDDGRLAFKIYVTRHNAKPLSHLEAPFRTKAGEVHRGDLFYDLKATMQDGTQWSATRIMPNPNWDLSDKKNDISVIMSGKLQSIAASLNRDFYKSKSKDYLRLHFFDEYELPLVLWSEVKDDNGTHWVTDRAEFEACGAQFEVHKKSVSGATVIEATSDKKFPVAFDLRVQEAIQYITAKTAIWRARMTNVRGELRLELAMPWRKASRTQFTQPIEAAALIEFRSHGWKLFGKYLEYVSKRTRGTYWNPVAYHLFNAREATANSVDAWAVGVSVAVEAVASLVQLKGDHKKTVQTKRIQTVMRKWLAEQSFPENYKNRIAGSIRVLSEKRPQDTMYALAKTGHVEKTYVDAWRNLRNRQVHPKLKDLKPSPKNIQKLLDDIHRTEVLLRQLTFFLIGYEGPFTDYGVHGGQAFSTKQYPLTTANTSGGQ